MYIQTLIILSLCVFVGAVYITYIIMNYAGSNRLIDMPNDRSMHVIPTPRGGGLSINLLTLLATIMLMFNYNLRSDYAIALIGSGLLISIVALLDDYVNLPIIHRVIAYSFAALFLSYVLLSDYYWAWIILSMFGVFWMVNLYNFMDGVDALAAIETISASLPAACYFWVAGSVELSSLCIVIAFSAFGFMVFNWPPAKIFMGDVGSCFLGLTFSGLAIIGEITGAVPIWIWLILFSVFICDTTLTLLKRIVTSQKWYSAHRTHSYQLAITLGWSQKKLIITILSINILYLWPLSLLAYYNREYMAQITLLAFFTITIMWALIQKKHITIIKQIQ